MKRFTTLLLVSILLVTCMLMPLSASAEGIDYYALTKLTNTELQDVINAARNHLLARSARSEGKLDLVNTLDGLQIYLTGKGEMTWQDTYEVEIVVINNTGRDISVSFDHVVINGWETSTVLAGGVFDIGDGKKKRGDINLLLDEAMISSISEVEDVELSFHTFDPSTYTMLRQFGPITIYYDGGNWVKP